MLRAGRPLNSGGWLRGRGGGRVSLGSGFDPTLCAQRAHPCMPGWEAQMHVDNTLGREDCWHKERRSGGPPLLPRPTQRTTCHVLTPHATQAPPGLSSSASAGLRRLLATPNQWASAIPLVEWINAGNEEELQSIFLQVQLF